MAERASRAERIPMAESRKFRALLLAILVYTVPIFMTFALVIMKLATKDDFTTMCKWMGASLSPAFLGYIGGVALEGLAQAKTRDKEE